MSGLEIAAIVTPLVGLLIAIGSGVKWLISLVIDTYREAAKEDATEIADLRNVRDDTLATAVSNMGDEVSAVREDIADIRGLVERLTKGPTP
jgi:hypothetical protein